MFRGLAHIFVNAFGITQPEPEKEERAGMIIAGALLVVLVVLVLAAVVLFKSLA